MININDINIRDPFILKEEGYYYLYGTNKIQGDKRGFYGYKSKDLINFEGPYPLYVPNDYGGVFWAPEVYKYQGKYYLIGTLDKENKVRKSYIFISDNPIGEFVPYIQEPITPLDWHCLDANLFVDEDGTPYLTFCREWIEVKNGRMYIAKLSKDLKKIIEEPKLLFEAKDAKWVGCICGYGYVTDGPFIYKKDNKYYMLWSSYNDNTYAISVISSDNIYGPWMQEEKPYLSIDGGHGMIFKDGGKVYLAIHAPNSINAGLKVILFDENAERYYISK